MGDGKMKKGFIRVISAVLVAVIVVYAAPLSGFVGLDLPNLADLFTLKADAVAYSGKCGDNLTWSLDTDTGVLTISGTGYMYSWSSDSYVPWYSNRSSIKTVVIGDSVTSIGRSAFENCTGITSVTIPDSVTSIGSWAFGDCESLTSVTIPDSVTSIGDYAFYNCTSLTSVTIPDSVTSIGYCAFKYCESLASVTIPDSVTSIGYCAFEDCTGLTSITVKEGNPNYSSDEYGVLFNKDKTMLIQYPIGNTRTSYTIPDSVTSISGYAFAWCTSLTSVTIGNSVTSIGEYAFYYCESLTSVTIPDSVTSIGGSAFYYCTSLTSVTIGNSVTSIGYGAFEYCESLASVTIPDSVTSIGNRAFEDCTGLTSVTIGNSVTSIGDYAFEGCTGLTSITVKEGNPNYSSDEYGVLFNKDKTLLIQYPIGNTRTSYTIPDSVTSIGNYAFYSCDSLTSVTIPDSVTSIGGSAFYYCTSLTSVTIGNSVTSIGYGAFEYCESLASVTIPDSVTSIGNRAFEDCTGLTSVTIGNSVTSIGDYAFEGCTGLTSVTIPDSVTSIGDWAFDNCTGLTSVTIPDSVTSIGDWAFDNCTGLTSVTIGNSVTSIGDYAFYDCTSLTDVYYTGSEEEWQSISIGSSNECLTNANIHFNSYKSSNNSTKVTNTTDSIKILPKDSETSVKIDITSQNINLALNDVTATVGGNTYTQAYDKTITIPKTAVTGDITIKKSGYNDYVIPKDVYDTFKTISLDNILDYSAYMTKSDGKGRPYISSAFGRVSGSGDSYVDLTKNSLKVTPGTSYDFYVTARNTSSSATYAITQDNDHKITPQSSGTFTLNDIADVLISGKTAYVYVTSSGTHSDLVPIRLNIENSEENPFVKQLKSGKLALGGSDGLTITVPEDWVLIGGSEFNIADFNFPVGVNVTGNKVKVSVGFDLWKKTTTTSKQNAVVDKDNNKIIDEKTYTKTKETGVIPDKMWKTVKDGIKDAEWSWKNAKDNVEKLRVKRKLADRYGIPIGDLSSSNQKKNGFNVSALGYIEGEIIGGKFVITDFLISCSGAFTMSLKHQMSFGYIGIEGGGKVTVSFNAARNVADTTVDFDLETGIQLTPTITPRAGLGWDGVACVGVYGTASMPMGLTFSFVDKALTGSVQIDGEIGCEAQLLIFKTGRKPLISGTVGPWTHTWNFGSRMSVNLYETVNPELFANCKSSSDVNADAKLELTERTNPSSWLSEPDFSTSSVITETGVTIEDLQTDVFANSGAKIVTCGNTTMAVWTADDTARDEYNRLKLVYSVYNNATETWSEPKAVYDDGHMDASPSLATDGKNIYVAWQKFVKTFDSTNSTELSDLMECAEIYTAKYDAQADAFVSATRITNDSVYDYAPSVVVKDGTANVFYATNANNALLSIDGNKISKYAGGNTTVLKSDLATINGLESAIVNSEIQIAFSTDTDGNLETTNDIALFYGLDTFNAVPNVIENVQSSVLNFTYADIDGETKLLYSDGLNIYYESEGEAVAILDEGATVSSQISAVKSGDVTNLFWLSSTDSGNELYTASYENGNWSDAIALTNRGNRLSNVALTYANNTLLGVANETLTTYDEATSSYTDGETNLVSIKLNDFVDLKADGMDIIEYDRAEGEMTGINVSVLNNGNVSLDRLYFDITDSNGYSKTYYIDTELLPGKTELCLLPYEIPTNFADTTVSVKVYSESYTDINEDDNTVSYKPENADLLASNLPVTYFKDGCIITTELANYSFVDADNVVATVYFDENCEEEKGVNYIGTLDNDSLISVDFAYAFDELTFDEDEIAKIYLTVTADNAQSTTLTYLVEKNETVCSHPVTESANDIAPTCTEEGHKAGVRCLGCGEYISGGEAIPATGHTAVVDKAVAPTCTKTGLTEGSHCSVCGEVITAQEEVPMTEHTDSNGDAKCDACGISMSDILPGETKTVEITGGSITYLKFVPTVSGNYSFTSVSSSDTYGYLYDADKNQITYNDDGGSGSNFLISYDLIKGTTYYFGCRYYSTSTSGSFDVTLTLNSALETLTPSENTTTVIDTLNGYIYGINPRMDNPLDYFSVNSGYYCDMNGSSTLPDGNSCYGTGSIFTVKSGDTVVAKYSLIIFGDVNGDGWYDGQDAITVSCLANGMLTREQVGEAVWMAADCNHDGVIDQLDVDLLNQAGVLLSSVDQTKPTEELLETSAEYNEYIGLIDQMGSEDTTETPTQDESDSFFTRIIAFIESIIKLISKIFTKIF